MKAYHIKPGAGLDSLAIVEQASRELAHDEIRVRVEVAALNHRDLSIAAGRFPNLPEHALVPLVDGCGVVTETGRDVTRFRVGERVITSYYPRWIDGSLTPEKTAVSFGAQLDGTLAEELVAHEDAFVRAPAGLDIMSAATLPCAGLTAWHALFGAGQARAGSSVLILGTGGVSLWALQIAKAAGLFAIVTSSQDDKLERARALGADATINYRTTPEWQHEVLRATGGVGVDVTVEVGGEATLPRSLAATAPGGTVVVIGRVSGGGALSVDPATLIGGARRLAGITTGSRVMLEQFARFVEVNHIAPVIDSVFPFADAAAAYAHLASGRHFGKIAVTVCA